MTCRSYRDGSVLHNFQLDPYTQDGFGSPHLIVHRKELLYILVAKARSLNVCLRTDCQTTGIDMKTRSVTTARGDTFTADLILGADGGRSFCRSFILGRPDLPKATGKLVYRFTISSEAVWRDPDFRDLVDPTAITCWIGPKSHVVAYELPHSGIYNVSLTCPDPIEGRAQFGPRDADMDELNQMFSEWDPVYVKLLRAADRAQYWTLLQLPEENRTWIDSETQRMLLIGDAAHSMTMYLYHITSTLSVEHEHHHRLTRQQGSRGIAIYRGRGISRAHLREGYLTGRHSWAAPVLLRETSATDPGDTSQGEEGGRRAGDGGRSGPRDARPPDARGKVMRRVP